MEEEAVEQFRLNPEEAKKLKETVNEMVLSMQRIKDEQSYLKDSCALMKEKFGIPLPITRKVATFILNEEKQAKEEQTMDMVDYLVELTK